MLKVLRIIIITILSIFICLIGTIYALIRLRHPSTVRVLSKAFASMHSLVGLKLIRRTKPDFAKPAIYIANHQNNYDMLTIASMVPYRTVSVGKKSLMWIPFFGLMYWATGNIFIHREKRSSAINTMNKVAEAIKDQQISIWMFPEGTRSRGRGLLPFKTGAFHTAIAAGVPIIPVVCSNLHNKVDLNRKNNGVVICEMLDPIDTSGYNRENLKELIAKSHQIMADKIAELDREVAELEQQK